MRTLRGSLVALVAASCAGDGHATIEGEVDGDEVKLGPAILVQSPGEDSAFDRIQVVAGGIDEDICDVLTGFAQIRSTLNESEVFSDEAAYWRDHMPADFWMLTLAIQVDDLTDDLQGRQLSGTSAFNGNEFGVHLLDDDQIGGQLVHFLRPLDLEYWTGLSFTGIPGDFTIDMPGEFDSFGLDAGYDEIVDYAPDEAIEGFFETTAVESVGHDEVGDLQIAFNAKRCAPLEQYLCSVVGDSGLSTFDCYPRVAATSGSYSSLTGGHRP